MLNSIILTLILVDYKRLLQNNKDKIEINPIILPVYYEGLVYSHLHFFHLFLMYNVFL